MMNKITYNKLYIAFTFQSVSYLLLKFWIDEVFSNNYYSKIWLSITVCNNDNKYFTLVKNLPFNILDYYDILIVINQVFNTNPFINRIDLIKSITFNFHFDNSNYNHNYIYNYNCGLLTYLILILLVGWFNFIF